MYSLDASKAVQARRLPLSPATVSRTVWFLGLTSLFTDISSEMVASILPLYLVVHLGLTPLQFGLVDGLYQGSTALVRLLGGLISDRWSRYKEVALAGYALSALCKPAMVAAGAAWPLLTSVIAIDRIGKGIRTAPRDALIRLSSNSSTLGVSFGVHRALDAGGAMVGPLVAYLLLSSMPNRFDALFIVSFCLALIGVWILALFVRNPTAVEGPLNRGSSLFAALPALLRDGWMRRVSICAFALTLATVSDGFLYLMLHRRMQVPGGNIPLLAFTTALFYMVAAVPFGRLADRIGRGQVFILGYGFLVGAYLFCLLAGGYWGALIVLGLLGAYYAATDGVLAALTSSAVPEHLSASALAFVITATSVSKLIASILFGWLLTSVGSSTSLVVFTVLLLFAMTLAFWQLRQPQEGSA